MRGLFLGLGLSQRGGGGGLSPALALDFTTGSLDSRITFTRASQATVVDSTGKVTYAPHNRFTYSDDLTNAAWTKVACTITANDATGSDGAATLDKVLFTAGSGAIPLYGQGTAVTSGVSYTLSFEVKYGNFQWLWVRCDLPNTGIVAFDLQNGVIGAETDPDSVIRNYTITSLGGGLYRCSLTWTPSTTGNANLFWNYGTGSTPSTASTTKAGTEYFHMGRIQLEAVTYQTTPGTYIPTTTAAVYGPRFDYNPVTLAPLGLLIEEQRTNLCLYSSDFTNAAWVKTNATASLTATGPDGASNSASILTATAGNATVLQTITSASAARATSCYVKRRTGSGVIEMTQDNGTTWAAVTVTGSWTRVSIASATVTNPVVGFRIVTSGDAIDVAYSQCETGAFITSAIPTVASTVTRSADVASMTGTNFSDWYNQTEGTFVCEATGLSKNSIAGPWAVLVTAGSNHNQMYSAFADVRQFRVFDGAAAEQVTIASSAVSVGVFSKIAAAYKVNDFAVSTDGGTVGADISGSVPTPTFMQLGGNIGTANCHIKSLSYYNTRLPNETLQELTA